MFKALIKAALPVSAITLSLLMAQLQPVSAQEEEADDSQTGTYVQEEASSDSPTGPYIQLGIGTGFGTEVEAYDTFGDSISGDTRTVLAGGIGIGYDFGPVRTDLSVSRSWGHTDNVNYRGIEYDVDDDAYGWGVGLGLAVDIETDSDWTPYVSISVGSGWGDDTDDNVWSYGAGIGVSYATSEKVDVYGQIGYGWVPSQEVDSIDFDSYGQFVIGAGVRFRM